MPRQKSIKIGALNVTLHPHSDEIYVQLIKDAKKLRRPICYRENHYAIMGPLSWADGTRKSKILHGILYRFLDFSQNSLWLNLEAQKPADPGELSEVMIPPHLKPGLAVIQYAFSVMNHRIYFEMRNDRHQTLGPTSAQKIFGQFFNQKELTDRYGEANVFVEPAKEALDKIFKIPELEKLVIDVTRPNPDNLEEEEKKVMQRLSTQNARRERIELIAQKGKSLKPNRDTELLARVAAANGSVWGKGKDEEGNPVEESTRDHPWSAIVKFNPKLKNATNAFIESVKSHVYESIKTLLD